MAKGFSLKRLLVSGGEEDKTVTSSVPVATISKVGFGAGSVSTPVAISDKDSESIRIHLATAMESASSPGFDYLKFINAVEAQKTAIPAENVRFQVVGGTAAVMGVTSSNLIESAKGYLKVLDDEEKNFSAAAAQQLKDNVTNKEAELSGIDGEIAKIAGQIQTLTCQINTMQQNKAKLSTEVSDNKTKIDNTATNFSGMLKIFRDKINSDMEKIKTYLPTQGTK
jgi:hypothetical protein